MGASRSSKVLSLSIAQGVMTIVSVISGMILARYLSVRDYGTYLQTFLSYDIAVPLLTFGIPSALYYFLPSSSRAKTLVLETMIILFVSGSIFSLFLIFGGTDLLIKRFDNTDLSETLQWMIFYPMYTFPVLIISAVLVIRDKTYINALYNVTTGVLLISCIILAAIITKGYEYPVLVRVFFPVLFFPVAIFLCFKYIPGRIEKPNLKSMVNILKFAIPLGLATILETLTLQMANIIVSSLTSPEDFAIYATGAKEIPLIGIITGSISVVIMAEMSEKCKKNDKANAFLLFRKSAIVSSCFLFPVMCFFMIFANDFIHVMFTNKYSESVLPFRIYLLFLPVRIVNYGSAFIALGQSKKIMYRSFFSLLISVILCYFFVAYWGVNGAAIAIVVTLYFWTTPYNWHKLSKAFCCKFWDILPLRRVGFIFLLSLLIGIIVSPILLIDILPLYRFGIGVMCFGIIYYVIFNKYISEFKSITVTSLKSWKLKR